MAFQPEFSTVTIANGATASGVAIAGPKTLIGIIARSTFDGTSLKADVSIDGTTYYRLTNQDGTDWEIVAAASEAYAIEPFLFLPWNYFKLVAASQTGASVLDIMVREIR